MAFEGETGGGDTETVGAGGTIQGAGTGLFTRQFAKTVGPDGQVYAVDIAPKFLEHIQKTAREAGLKF